MATTVGESVHSDESVVAQFDEVAAGTTIESLVIKFEGYLQSSSSCGNTSRDGCRVVRVAQPQGAEATRPEGSTQAEAGGSFPPEPVEAEPKFENASLRAAEWVDERSLQTPVQEESTIRVDADYASAVDMNAPRSKRSKQRRRKALAHLEAQSLIPYDSLNYYSGLRGINLLSQVPIFGEPLKSGELSSVGEPNSMSQVPTFGEPLKTGEPSSLGEPISLSQVSIFGEPLKSGEPSSLGEPNLLSQVPIFGEPLKSGEPSSLGEPNSVSQVLSFGEPSAPGELYSSRGLRQTGGLHQARLTAQVRQKGEATARQTGAGTLYQSRLTGEPRQPEPRQHTHAQMGVTTPFACTGLTPVSDHDSDDCSATAMSQTSSSIQGRHASVHMTDIPEEISRRLDEQQATLNSMKEVIEQLLSEKKKKKERTSRTLRKSSKHKERVPTPSHSLSESSRGASSSGHNPRDKRFDEFQSQLDALKLQKHMNKLGVVRPYPIEWDTVSYPAKFQPLDLLQFDGKGSPAQHIYYFQAQTGHIMGNDPIMTRLFIGTLKGVAFEWFRRLEPESITCWKDMERLFMARFFDDDKEISVTTLLAAKQGKTESVSNFVKKFRNRSLHTRDHVSEATLIEICRNNLSISILSNMGAIVACSWKDLIRQGEQVESMLKRMDDEEPHEFRGDDDQDALVVETVSSYATISPVDPSQ